MKTIFTFLILLFSSVFSFSQNRTMYTLTLDHSMFISESKTDTLYNFKLSIGYDWETKLKPKHVHFSIQYENQEGKVINNKYSTEKIDFASPFKGIVHDITQDQYLKIRLNPKTDSTTITFFKDKKENVPIQKYSGKVTNVKEDKLLTLDDIPSKFIYYLDSRTFN